MKLKAQLLRIWARNKCSQVYRTNGWDNRFG
jgi:hypothetical protein